MLPTPHFFLQWLYLVIYHQAAGPNSELNQTALDKIGLPVLTDSNIW